MAPPRPPPFGRTWGGSSPCPRGLVGAGGVDLGPAGSAHSRGPGPRAGPPGRSLFPRALPRKQQHLGASARPLLRAATFAPAGARRGGGKLPPEPRRPGLLLPPITRLLHSPLPAAASHVGQTPSKAPPAPQKPVCPAPPPDSRPSAPCTLQLHPRTLHLSAPHTPPAPPLDPCPSAPHTLCLLLSP